MSSNELWYILGSSLYLFLMIWLLWVKRPIIKYFFRKISGRTWTILTLVFLAGLLFRIHGAPHIILRDHLHGYDVLGDALRLDPSSANGSTLPYFVMLANIIFGTNANNLFSINVFFGSISVILLFLFVYSIVRDQKQSLFAAAALAFLPAHIKYSSSDLLIISGIAFSLLSLIALLIYSESKEFSVLLISIFSLYFATASRLEMSFFPLIFIVAILTLCNKSVWKEYKFYIALGIFGVIISKHALGVLTSYLLGPLAIGESPSVLKNAVLTGQVSRLFNVDFNTFLNPLITPWPYIILIGLGFVYLLFKKQKILLFSLSWILVFFYLQSPREMRLNLIFQHARFNLQFMVPFLVLCTIGFYLICVGACLFMEKKGATVTKSLVVLTLIISPIIFAPFIQAHNYNPQIEYKFIDSIKDKLPQDSTLIYYDPKGIGGLSATLFEYSSKNVKIHPIRKADQFDPVNLFYYEGLSCYRHVVWQQTIHPECLEMHQKYALTQVASLNISNKPYNQHDDGINVDHLQFALYKISGFN